jgi:hypothetical protein
MVLGTFQDDYGSSYEITRSEWRHVGYARYHIAHWQPASGYLVARNDPSNPTDGGRWTRIDWVRLDGMQPFEWAFCMSAYDAATEAAAESTSTARRDSPRTGCNGFPFSRMRRASASSTGSLPAD